MTAVPWELFEDIVKGDDIKMSGVGMFFLPQVHEVEKWRSEAKVEEWRVGLGLMISFYDVITYAETVFCVFF